MDTVDKVVELILLFLGLFLIVLSVRTWDVYWLVLGAFFVHSSDIVVLDWKLSSLMGKKF